MFRPFTIALFTCFVAASSAFGQTPTPESPAPAKVDKAAGYYYYSLGHLYSEMAGQYTNRTDYFNKAVDAYKQAMKADPSASFISEELSELYVQFGHLRDAVTEAEDTLKQNPNDINARRVLARIYTRLIGDQQQNRVDDNMLKKAIEQYQKITEADPKDAESWLMLGRLEKVSQNSTEAVKDYKKALELQPDDEDAMTGLAMVYADLGDTKSAADLLKRAADKDPNPRTLAGLASAYEQMKEYALAAEALKRAMDQAQGNPELQHALAQDLLLSDQVEDALKLYQQMASDDPKDAQAELRISQIYRQKGDLPNARVAAEKAKEIDPTNVEVQYNDVNLLEAEGKTADAITTLRGILSTTTKKTYTASERNSRAILVERLAYLYRQSEQYDKAVQTFGEWADLDPDSAPRATAQIVETYRLSKNYPRAEQEATAALRKFPKDRTIHLEHANLLSDMGKTDQAVSETRALLGGSDADNREIYISLAQIYEKAKNFGEMKNAIDSAEKLATAKEDKETIAFMRGTMYERMKQYDQAEAEFKKVIDLNPDNGSALNYLGYMLADRNVRLTEAHGLIQKALEKEPNNGSFLDSMGWVLFRENKLPEAEQNLRHALEYLSTDPTVHDHLGDVYFHENRVRDAIAQWQTSLQEWNVSAASDLDTDEVAKVQKKLESARVRLARESGATHPTTAKP